MHAPRLDGALGSIWSNGSLVMSAHFFSQAVQDLSSKRVSQGVGGSVGGATPCRGNRSGDLRGSEVHHVVVKRSAESYKFAEQQRPSPLLWLAPFV
jgi:hypothetical protein